jgi:DNA-binding XRE family transcriptional regulator
MVTFATSIPVRRKRRGRGVHRPILPPWWRSPACSSAIGNAGWSVGQAAWRLGVSVREYREIEAGERIPSWETFDRICRLFGWPQTFASGIRR